MNDPNDTLYQLIDLPLFLFLRSNQRLLECFLCILSLQKKCLFLDCCGQFGTSDSRVELRYDLIH